MTNQRFAFGQERLHEQSQEYPARFLAGPHRAVEDTMVALVLLGSPQAHEPQGGADGPLARDEDRACE
jgi:hypothetical protein